MNTGSSENTAYLEFQKKVSGQNINPQTLLATDYLNHFNEVHMLLEMLPDMPECLEDVQHWSPKSYQEHFRDSVFQAKDLAIEAYEHAPDEHRLPFEKIVQRMDALILQTVAQVSAAVAEKNGTELHKIIKNYSPKMQKLIDECSAIINGARPVVHQEDIDSYFSETSRADDLFD
ncbi:hypothetical protein [Luteithermobacter gelatinilyticus]|uniref:hypothetical protein n=1 Tax=Luteithermobacter gelatinilyticus TaxID=2582913 RepID=UPI001AEF4974|nr:hypothetical protein [Luteithermobacter gelatinilyticus]